MSTVESIYLTLLRHAVTGEKSQDFTCTFSEMEWKDLVALANRQGTSALVFNEVLNRKDDVPDDMRQQMRSMCAMQMMRQPRLQNLIITTFDALLHAGLHPVLLKGFGLAELYPRPELRSWGDLDVYVGPDQYHDAAEILRKAFPEARHHDEEWEELKHYNFVLPDGLVEMHRVSVKMEHPRDKKVYYALEREAMSPDRVECLALREPDMRIDIPEGRFNMLFTFLHAWNHFVDEGLGMKQLCDVFLLARKTYERESAKPYSDYSEYMRRNLKALRLTQPWQLIGYVLVEYLRLPSEMWPGYRDRNDRWLKKHGERFFRRIMEEGVLRDEAAEKMKTRYEERERNLRMPLYLRKLKTLRLRFESSRWLREYSEEYARHRFSTAVYRGIKRLFQKEETVLY